MVGRLKGVMTKLIGPAQASFIPGRLSSDNFVVVQEAVHSMRCKKGTKGWMLLKLDLEKAYDRIRWDFLEDTLNAAGLSNLWVRWIMTCVSGPSMSLLINGERTEAFRPLRGLRQGDPLSPYLFVLCLERLCHLIEGSIEEKKWKPISLSRGGPKLSHICFADDLILFAEASVSQVRVIHSVLESFRAEGWKGRLLSFAGRLTLTKAVLSSIHVHSMSTIKLPMSILNQLDGVSRDFLWGRSLEKRKQYLVAWDRVCYQRKTEGLMNARSNWSSTWRSVGIGLREVVLKGQSWAPENVPVDMQGLMVRDLWQDGVGWDFTRISPHVSENQILELVVVVVDSVVEARDKLSWGETADGKFTVKSAYALLTRDDTPRPNVKDFYQRVWKVMAPERVRTFLWLVGNQVLMTNEERFRRHLCDTQECGLACYPFVRLWRDRVQFLKDLATEVSRANERNGEDGASQGNPGLASAGVGSLLWLTHRLGKEGWTFGVGSGFKGGGWFLDSGDL
ncbi:PREDICTED: uncharacterized protein LOC104751234 [Camelina sativa]|uniref:Uncharacterized protein LOC104751234 n=1 Tax=Camelina sativa TaxID=90675 RepID=A0ABM0WI87_CAMSA|nr:PREDICTED: uncharacterized protein LOC104751234 [Camelina sativa]